MTVFLLQENLSETPWWGASELLAAFQPNWQSCVVSSMLQLSEKISPVLPQAPGVIVFELSDDGQKSPLEALQLKVAEISRLCPTFTLVAALGESEMSLLGQAAPSALAGLDCYLLSSASTPAVKQHMLGLAMRQAELRHTVELASNTDEATQLYNRQYFMRRLAEDIAVSKRHKAPLSVVVLGIGQYHWLLDSYGDAFIEGMLLKTAAIVQKHIRLEDLAARIGDDEIALLLPHIPEKQAKIPALRIIQQLNETRFDIPHKPGETEQLSFYAGVVGLSLTDASPTGADILLRYGRHALHLAKQEEDETAAEGVQLFSEIQPVF